MYFLFLSLHRRLCCPVCQVRLTWVWESGLLHADPFYLQQTRGQWHTYLHFDFELLLISTYHDPMNSRSHGLTLPWFHDPMVSRSNGFTIPWFHRQWFMISWFHDTIHDFTMPWFHDDMVSRSHSFTGPWFHDPWFHEAMVSRCRGFTMRCSHDPLVSRSPDFMMHGFAMPWFHDAMVADPDGLFVSTGACNLGVPGSHPGREGYLSSWLCI